MDNPPLDLDAVRAFLRVIELGSFTRAAEAMGTTQSAVSLKVKRLEARLGRRLIDRTPRHVQISTEGAQFLGHARALIEAHDRAVAAAIAPRDRLVLGISDHVAGPELPVLIARMNAETPDLSLEIRIASSADLLRRYDRREIDSVIVRHHAERDDGERIADEPFRWFAARSWQPRAGEPLPVATMPDPCGVRRMAGDLLDAAGLPWTEVFTGGGVAAVAAAVTAGLGIAALAPRMLPFGVEDVGPRLGLPPLPRQPIMLHTRERQGRARDTLRVLSAAYRSAVRG